ncbi:MAG: phospholipase [Ideonella sp. WA131b]|jgi:phospholipase/lecithinase/hemolysin|nr:phospholipase [Ideonella sp. WA131b]
MIRLRTTLTGLALAALLVACGGNDGNSADTTPAVRVAALKVMGDSLADVGTFGLRFTVQGSESLTFPERIGVLYGLGRGCNFFAFTGTTFVPNTAAGCSNYAIGGGVINGTGSGLTPSDPRIISVQLAAATAAGNFGANDLLLVDGGGNDAATLVGAYLSAATDGGAAYTALLGTLLTPAQVAAAVSGGAAGLAAAGGQYMQALADRFADQLRDGALNKGARRMALLNMPGITNTPRFQAVLDGIAAASGGGNAGAAARAQSEALFKGWVEAFNARLAARFAGNTSVVIIDFYTAFNEQIAMPAQYGLSNVRATACPVTGVGTDGLPTYNFATCTDTALSAAPPAGATGGANWWRSYAFSDGFHPTPYGHQLLAQAISLELARAGWL